RVGHITVREIILDRRRRQRARRPRMNQQRAKLRREDQLPAIEMGVVKRLLADAVAGEKELPTVAVPDGKGKHPGKPVQAAGAPFLPGMDDRLGVGAGAENMPGGLQGAAQRLEIVNLAVEDEDDRAVLVLHRLRASGEVDDAEATVAEADARLQVKSVPVRAPMRQGSGHPAQQGSVDRPRPAQVGYSGDPAHRYLAATPFILAAAEAAPLTW